MADDLINRTFGLGEVITTLGTVLRIHPDGLSPFGRWIEGLFQRLPDMAGEGKGKRRSYTERDILALAVITDILAVGIAPEHLRAMMVGCSPSRDKYDGFSAMVAKAAAAGEPLCVTSDTVEKYRRPFDERGTTYARISVGEPSDPVRYGPYAVVFPEARAAQIAATIGHGDEA